MATVLILQQKNIPAKKSFSAMEIFFSMTHFFSWAATISPIFLLRSLAGMYQKMKSCTLNFQAKDLISFHKMRGYSAHHCLGCAMMIFIWEPFFVTVT